MSERTAKVLLASVILARSSSYVLQKISLTDIDVFNLMGIRFLMAFLIMLLIFNKKLLHADKASIAAGLAVGTVYFVVMSFEVFSLKTCESSTTAFLENTAIVMVPLFEAFLLKKMPLPKKADALIIGIVQLGTMGSLSAISSFIFETPHLPSEPMAWLAIVLLALVCSCFGFTLQPVAQKYTSAETTGLYCAFGPLGAGILGWICLGEALSIFALIGAVLILLSIVLVQKSQSDKQGLE